MFSITKIVASSYYDSVVLMRVASQLRKRQGVSEVAMFMGTDGNHELLAQVGLTTKESREAGPQDLIIIVQANTEPLATAIAEEAERELNTSRETTQSAHSYRPRTLDRAIGFLPGASLAAISIPGEYAARAAAQCLDHGLHVFLFSDNVPVADEARLKKTAVAKGLLCMGPDCGTAYLNGVGLGFSNVVRRGRVGCVAASGTGLQAVACALDRLGEGISHAIGVGGRDLSREVAGLMTTHALALLDQDPATEVILLLSKPPHPEVAHSLLDFCRTLSTPVVSCFQGARLPSDFLVQAETLDDAANLAACLVQERPFVRRLFTHPAEIGPLLAAAGTEPAGKRIVGLFCGGTLAKEASLLLTPLLGPIASDLHSPTDHTIVDLGDDRYTIGRPHPMIAPENRSEILLELATRGELENCGVLLVDIVLGNGAHLDPAGELAWSLQEVRKKSNFAGPIVVSLIGTEHDPQQLDQQMRMLTEAGATLFFVNSEAARYAAMLVSPPCRSQLLEEYHV
jgi:FdrA protein